MSKKILLTCRDNVINAEIEKILSECQENAPEVQKQLQILKELVNDDRPKTKKKDLYNFEDKRVKYIDFWLIFDIRWKMTFLTDKYNKTIIMFLSI